MADDRALETPTADVPDAGTAPPEASNEELGALAGGGMESSASPLSGADYSESAAQGSPEFFQPNDTPQQPSSNPRPWARILMGAMQGMAGADGKSFAGGMAGGIRAYQAHQQQDAENAQRQEWLAQQQQRTMDAHQVAQSNLATAHLEQQNLVRAYNLAPKSTQDIIDQASMSAGEKAKELPGTKIIGSYGTYAEAQTQATAEMKANTQNPLNTMVFHNAQGGFDVISVANPEKLNDKPVDVTIGYDFKSKKPITKTYAAGTISFATQMDMETKAVSKAADANNGLEEFRQKQQIEQGKEIAVLKAKQNLQQTGEWKPKVTADEKKKAELAENIAFNANEVNNTLARRPELIGAIAGRATNVQQLIGNNDPDISAIGTHIHNIAMANSGVHGFRSQEGVEATEANLLNHFKNGPKAVSGALNANVGSVQTFIDNARPSNYQTSSSQGGAGAYFKQKSPGIMYASAPGQPRMQSVDGGKTWQAAK